ncbi:MAG: AgmX/PglI C-terminal domain-containing protein [Polyangia bacterium]
MTEKQSPTRSGGSKLVFVLFGLGLAILAAGVAILVMNRSDDSSEKPEEPEEPPKPEQVEEPAPLVVTTPSKPLNALEDKDAGIATEEEDEQEKKQRRQGGLGGRQGKIDPRATNEFINARFAQVRACYERRLKINPLLEGVVNLRIRLNPKGKVGSVSVNSDTVGDPQMVGCIKKTLRGWTFPAPQGGWGTFDKAFRFKKKQ